MTNKENVIRNIKTNYEHMERSFVEQLAMRHDIHGTTIGTHREELWEQIFEMIIPKKFVIEHSIFIIDSDRGISHEVDLAVIDEMYTPYIFRYGKLKFVPIEAVAIVIECKSTGAKKKKKTIDNWFESIELLKTNKESICRLATMISMEAPKTQTATVPIKILCALDSVHSEYKEKFDFVLSANLKAKKVNIEVDRDRSLKAWWIHLCLADVTEPELSKIGEMKKLEMLKLKDFEIYNENKEMISLLTLNYQLNQLLMLLNNPMPFPHLAYAKLFQE